MSTPFTLSGDPWLIAGGVASIAAAAAHLACIVRGPEMYGFLGAPPQLVRAAQSGAWRPTLFAFGIAALLTLWAAYAFAGAGLIPRLPLMRVALTGISAVYLLRGLVIVRPSLLGRPDLSQEFMLWSSVIVLAMGAMYAVGTRRLWPAL